jgi:hypothetical protein
MAVTYEPIATTTLGSNALSIVLSSIPSSYTDLRFVISNITRAATNSSDALIRFNGVSTSTYGVTSLYGNGTAATSASFSNWPGVALNMASQFSTSTPSFVTVDVFSYTSSLYKTCLITSQQDFNGSGSVERTVSRFPITSAITSIGIYYGSGSGFATGTTATLYGIKAA